MAFVFTWIAFAACAEIIARTTPFWAAQTLSGWTVWIASAAFVGLAVLDRSEPHFFTPLDLSILGLAGFSALTAYGAAPGRRWLRGAGVTGFIAVVAIIFTLIDNMLLAGLALIIFGVLLTVLILVTNGMLRRRGLRTPIDHNLEEARL